LHETQVARWRGWSVIGLNSMPRVLSSFDSVLALLAIAAAVSLRAAQPTSVELFGLHEVSLNASGSYANPYAQCSADAELLGPDGIARSLPLFWDGGSVWKLRFSPALLGQWNWRIHSADAGLDGKHGDFYCRPSARRGSITRMPAAPHHFQYQNGEPIWFMGDTAWSFFTDVPAERHDGASAARYLEHRAAQGFNVIHAMLLSEAGDGNAGGAPFSDLQKELLNPGYWQVVDNRVAFANARGVVVGLVLAWGRKVAGASDREPYAWGRFPGQDARKRYARYIAARYSAYDVYFIVSGEWQAEIRTRPSTTEVELRDEFIAIGDALRSADPHRRMMAIHPGSGGVREFNRAGWMDFGDYQQNYRQLHERILTSRELAKPVVNSEYAYFLRDQDGDGVTDKDNSLNVEDIRHASWDIVMAGGYFVTGFGTTYFGGNRDPGPFDPDAAKNEVWEAQVQHLKKFFAGVEYWKLIPADPQFTSRTARGRDRTETLESRSGGSRVRRIVRPPVCTYWALQTPGALYVLYVRGLTQPATFVIEGVGGIYQVERFDPRTGETITLAPCTFPEQVDQAKGMAAAVSPASSSIQLTNRFTFTAPDTQDWVYVLRRAR
jgi:hypothetical protein